MELPVASPDDPPFTLPSFFENLGLFH
jgi:hypothetical protein